MSKLHYENRRGYIYDIPVSYQHIRDFFTILEKEILNILRRRHFAVRYFLHSGSLLEANPIVLAIYYIHLSNYLTLFILNI